MNCKLCANYLQLVFELCAISEQIVCKHRHTDKNTSCCTSRVAFMAKTDMPSPVYSASVHKTSILYKCIQNQFTVQEYTKPVNCTSVNKTSLWYKCTQNQFMVQVYTKPVYSTSVHKTSLLSKCTQNQFTVQVYTKSVYCTSLHKTSLLVNNERNVQGRNITKVKECTGTEHYQG